MLNDRFRTTRISFSQSPNKENEEFGELSNERQLDDRTNENERHNRPTFFRFFLTCYQQFMQRNTKTTKTTKTTRTTRTTSHFSLFSQLWEQFGKANRWHQTTYIKIFCLSSLLSISVVGGYFLYHIFDATEKKIANDEFTIFRRQILDGSQQNFDTAAQGIRALAGLYTSNCLYLYDWPNCLLDQDVVNVEAQIIIDSLILSNYGFGPFINGTVQDNFEDFYLNFYDGRVQTPEEGIPGIFGFDRNSPFSDFKYHVGGPNDPLGTDTQNRLIAPLVQSNTFELGLEIFGYNEYTERERRIAIDQLFRCSEKAYNKKNKTFAGCTVLSDFITFPTNLNTPEDDIPPLVLIFSESQPLRELQGIPTGYTVASVPFQTLLERIIPKGVRGIRVEFSNGVKKHRFLLEDGEVSYLGLRPCNGCKTGTLINLRHFDSGSARFYIEITRTSEFDNTYRSETPWIAVGIYVGIIVFHTLMFTTYDYLVNQRIRKGEIILKTKQQFVRYISHEIRGPLNAITVGVQILLNEMEQICERFQRQSEDGTSSDERNRESYDLSQKTSQEASQNNINQFFQNSENYQIREVKKKDKEEEKYNCEEEKYNKNDLEETHITSNDLLLSLNCENPKCSEHSEHSEHLKSSPDDNNDNNGNFLSENLLNSPSSSNSSQVTTSSIVRDIFEWKSICHDMYSSCVTSTQVLNSILSYEKFKLTDGIILQNTLFCINSLCKKVVRTFQSVSSSKYVSLTMEFIEKEHDDDELDKEDNNQEADKDDHSLDNISRYNYAAERQYLVYGDEAKTEQVLGNLLSNSLKFTHNGKVTVFLSVTQEREKHRAFDKMENKRQQVRNGWKKQNFDERTNLTENKKTNIELNDNSEQLSDSKHSNNSMKNRNDSFSSFLMTNNIDHYFTSEITVSVVDTGIGIAEENINSLFQEGYQIDPRKNQSGGGSGFGLFLCKNIIERQNGKIWCSSKGLNQGASFSFRLPAAPVESFSIHFLKRYNLESLCIRNEETTTGQKSSGQNAKKKKRKKTENLSKNNYDENAVSHLKIIKQKQNSDTDEKCTLQNNQEKSSDSRKLCILYVEDSFPTLKLVRRMLEKLGISVETATDGLEALQILKEKESQGVKDHFDMILTDNQMPNMNGRELVSHLRTKHNYLGYIVGLTGSVSEDEVQEFFNAGCDNVLHKPIDEKLLQKVLEICTARKKLKNENLKN